MGSVNNKCGDTIALNKTYFITTGQVCSKTHRKEEWVVCRIGKPEGSDSKKVYALVERVHPPKGMEPSMTGLWVEIDRLAEVPPKSIAAVFSEPAQYTQKIKSA